MISVLVKTWALFFGFAILCLGHGLQGTIISVRAVYEGFSLLSIGVIASGFYLGYLVGSIIIPILLERVGHIRVFAALASVASVAILLHTISIDPISWFFFRILSGLSIAGIYIIMESWLNDQSTNDTRGKLLSVYMIVTFTFAGLGHFLLNLSDPMKVNLFILASILLSIALVPILLSVTQAPLFTNPKRFSLKELYIISPLGFVGALITGLTHGTLFGYGAVYATAKNFNTFEISLFMVFVTAFGALSQWPIGYLSDKIDRRIMLIGVTLIASGLSVLIVISSYFSLIVFFIILALYSSMCLPMYSLCVAHTNDYLNPNEIVSASAAIAILIGLGAILGPIITSFFMNIFGTDGFFVYLFGFHLLLGIFGLYRMSKRNKPSDIESQYYPLPRNISSAGMELNPKVDSTNK